MDERSKEEAGAPGELEPIPEITFNYALLYALAVAECTVFNSSRHRIDLAFERAVVARLQEPWAPRVVEWIGPVPWKDRMFGVYRAIDALIIDGMRGCLLTLDSPDMVTARIQIDHETALLCMKGDLKKGRYEAATYDWFLETGRRFKEALDG